jgi:mannose-6-phosphate isomerase-like protein (cupin superfamily)
MTSDAMKPERRVHSRSGRFVVVGLGLFAAVACKGTKAPSASSDSQPAQRAVTAAESDGASAASGSPSETRTASASPLGAIVLFRADSLRGVADRLTRDAITGRTVIGGDAYRLVVSRRGASGSPEVHEQWLDLTLVQAGRATLVAGGRLDGGRREAGGEWRSGTIVGGAPYPVAAGDLFVLPAGVPHQFQVARGDTIRYLTVKVPRRAHP